MNLKQHLEQEAKLLIDKKSNKSVWLTPFVKRETYNRMMESLKDDTADPIIDPHQDQPGSGSPAFGLPPSGQGTPKDMWGRKKPKPKHTHEPQTFVDEPKTDRGVKKENIGQQDINSSPAKELRNKPKDPHKLYTDREPLPELSAGGAGFVTTGPRNYGLRPPGPNYAGPSPMEDKKYKMVRRVSEDTHVVEIFENDKCIYATAANSQKEASKSAVKWLQEYKRKR